LLVAAQKRRPKKDHKDPEKKKCEKQKARDRVRRDENRKKQKHLCENKTDERSRRSGVPACSS